MFISLRLEWTLSDNCVLQVINTLLSGSGKIFGDASSSKLPTKTFFYSMCQAEVTPTSPF
jgi:hypothetical protein